MNIRDRSILQQRKMPALQSKPKVEQDILMLNFTPLMLLLSGMWHGRYLILEFLCYKRYDYILLY